MYKQPTKLTVHLQHYLKIYFQRKKNQNFNDYYLYIIKYLNIVNTGS